MEEEWNSPSGSRRRYVGFRRSELEKLRGTNEEMKNAMTMEKYRGKEESDRHGERTESQVGLQESDG